MITEEQRELLREEARKFWLWMKDNNKEFAKQCRKEAKSCEVELMTDNGNNNPIQNPNN